MINLIWPPCTSPLCGTLPRPMKTTLLLATVKWGLASLLLCLALAVWCSHTHNFTADLPWVSPITPGQRWQLFVPGSRKWLLMVRACALSCCRCQSEWLDDGGVLPLPRIHLAYTQRPSESSGTGWHFRLSERKTARINSRMSLSLNGGRLSKARGWAYGENLPVKSAHIGLSA